MIKNVGRPASFASKFPKTWWEYLQEEFARHAFLVEECKRLHDDILQGISNDTFQVDIGHVEMRNSDFRTKSTVGNVF